MGGRGTAQMGHAEEKSEYISSPVDQTEAFARMLQMLEKLDSRVSQIEGRQKWEHWFWKRSGAAFSTSGDPSHITASSRIGHDWSCMPELGHSGLE